MPVIAIVGAGPQMGFAIAKTFGAKGYIFALLSGHPTERSPLKPTCLGLVLELRQSRMHIQVERDLKIMVSAAR